MSKRITTIILALALSAMQAASCAADTLDLAALISEAETNSPSLAAMKARYEASRERIPQAGALDDPMLGVGIQNLPVDSFAFDVEPMTSKMFEVSQTFPYWGKRPLRREAAERESESLAAGYDDDRLMLRAEVKAAYFELYAVRKGIETVAKNIGLMDVFTRLAETRYTVGMGTMRDVIKSQVETAMLVEKRLDLEREDRVKRAYLASLIGRDRPVEGDVPDITPTPVQYDRETLAARAAESRPAMRSALYKIKKGEVMVELARKEAYPDFTISATYMQRDDPLSGMEQPDMISAVLTVNLPVWRAAKLDPMVREAALEKVMAEKEMESVRTGIYYKTGSLMDEVEQYDRIMKLYRDTLIPHGTDDMDAVLANYESGKSDFMDLLESRRALYDFELTYHETLAMREKAVAELEAVTGVEFK
ncbi:MAG: TolC family protein [Nitrospirae bacterium]|nr:TolC family protein [Nitrospirota bacterium]